VSRKTTQWKEKESTKERSLLKKKKAMFRGRERLAGETCPLSGGDVLGFCRSEKLVSVRRKKQKDDKPRTTNSQQKEKQGRGMNKKKTQNKKRVTIETKLSKSNGVLIEVNRNRGKGQSRHRDHDTGLTDGN